MTIFMERQLVKNYNYSVLFQMPRDQNHTFHRVVVCFLFIPLFTNTQSVSNTWQYSYADRKPRLPDKLSIHSFLGKQSHDISNLSQGEW